MKTPFKPSSISVLIKTWDSMKYIGGKKGLHGRSLNVNCFALFLLKCKVVAMFVWHARLRSARSALRRRGYGQVILSYSNFLAINTVFIKLSVDNLPVRNVGNRFKLCVSFPTSVFPSPLYEVIGLPITSLFGRFFCFVSFFEYNPLLQC